MASGRDRQQVRNKANPAACETGGEPTMPTIVWVAEETFCQRRGAEFTPATRRRAGQVDTPCELRSECRGPGRHRGA